MQIIAIYQLIFCIIEFSKFNFESLCLFQYFTPGHSLMEADNTHAEIQRSFNNLIEGRLNTPASINDLMQDECGYTVVKVPATQLRDYDRLAKDNVLPLYRSFAKIMTKFLINYEKVRFSHTKSAGNWLNFFLSDVTSML